jgi:hypothetical protein
LVERVQSREVVAIAGNHDNGAALDALRPWAAPAGGCGQGGAGGLYKQTQAPPPKGVVGVGGVGTLSGAVNDDGPAASADSKTQDAEYQPVTIDVFANDKAGAGSSASADTGPTDRS